jgi:transposase
LRSNATAHPRPELVTEPLFLDSPFFDPNDALQVKYEMLRTVRVDGVAVLHACRSFGLSRPSYYHASAAFDRDGIAGLLPAKRGPRHAHKLSGDVLQSVRDWLHDNPSLTPARLAELLQHRLGIVVHPRSIQRALARSEKKTR